jgi:hypothetical protein
MITNCKHYPYLIRLKLILEPEIWPRFGFRL